MIQVHSINKLNMTLCNDDIRIADINSAQNLVTGEYYTTDALYWNKLYNSYGIDYKVASRIFEISRDFAKNYFAQTSLVDIIRPYITTNKELVFLSSTAVHDHYSQIMDLLQSQSSGDMFKYSDSKLVINDSYMLVQNNKLVIFKISLLKEYLEAFTGEIINNKLYIVQDYSIPLIDDNSVELVKDSLQSYVNNTVSSVYQHTEYKELTIAEVLDILKTTGVIRGSSKIRVIDDNIFKGFFSDDEISQIYDMTLLERLVSISKITAEEIYGYSYSKLFTDEAIDIYDIAWYYKKFLEDKFDSDDVYRIKESLQQSDSSIA